MNQQTLWLVSSFLFFIALGWTLSFIYRNFKGALVAILIALESKDVKLDYSIVVCDWEVNGITLLWSILYSMNYLFK